MLRQSFKGTVVNGAVPSLHGGSVEIILTDPLSSFVGEKKKLMMKGEGGEWFNFYKNISPCLTICEHQTLPFQRAHLKYIIVVIVVIIMMIIIINYHFDDYDY